MLKADRVAIPAPIEIELKRSAEFVDNIMEFAREDLIGFRRPLAATFALTAPVVMAFAFSMGGLGPFIQIGAAYFSVAFLGLYLVGRNAWPEIVQNFDVLTNQKRKASADLRCGFSERCFLNLTRAPRFFEYSGGVLVFVDAGDFKTLFFNIESSHEDPRWDLYINGELSRRVWKWLRLPISRAVVKCSAEGSRVANVPDPVFIRNIDVWETINTSFDEPMDGAIIHRPFTECITIVERSL